jgi:hypothetical protein
MPVRLESELAFRIVGIRTWSQNLGHEDVLTTFNSYGYVQTRRQGELILGLGEVRRSERSDAKVMAEAVARHLRSLGAVG